MTAPRRRPDECAVCAQPLPRVRQRPTGRRRRFCSNRCRQTAFRNRQAEILVGAHRSPGALRNDGNTGVQGFHFQLSPRRKVGRDGYVSSSRIKQEISGHAVDSHS
jgi:hypothetical protein